MWKHKRSARSTQISFFDNNLINMQVKLENWTSIYQLNFRIIMHEILKMENLSKEDGS